MTEEIDFPRNKIPGEVHRFMSMNSDNKSYKRMLYLSDLNFRTEELKEVEKDVKEVELLIRYRPIGIGKMRLMVNMGNGINKCLTKIKIFGKKTNCLRQMFYKAKNELPYKNVL